MWNSEVRHRHAAGVIARIAMIAALGLIAGSCVNAGPVPPAVTPPYSPGQTPDAATRVLVFTANEREHPASTVAASALLAKTAPGFGIGVEVTDDPTAFSDESLGTYDAVVFLNTEGDIINDGEQAALERFMAAGGSMVAVGSAIKAEPGSQWWANTLGARFARQPFPLGARVTVEDTDTLPTGLLPRTFSINDAFYDYTVNPRNDPATKVLMTIDNNVSPCDAIGGQQVGPGCEILRLPGDFAMGDDHPIAWQREVGDSRMLYTNIGYAPESWQRPEATQHILGAIRWAVGEDRRDVASVVADDLDEPVRMDVDDQGLVYLVERTGRVAMVDPNSGVVTNIGHIEVATRGEQGLFAIVLDPDFATNRQLYLSFIEGTDTTANVIARFSLDPSGQIEMASRHDLLSVPLPGNGHSGGSLAIAGDGTLLITEGDNVVSDESAGFAPLDTRPGKEINNSLLTAANPDDLHGKVLRINRDGSIPEGNMFPGGIGGRPEILAMGFRNPFSVATGPTLRDTFVGDVGPDAPFDGGPGPRSYDEINWIDAPGDYGWPKCNGDRLPYREKDFGTGALGPAFDCSATKRPVFEYEYLQPNFWALGTGPRTGVAAHYLYGSDLDGEFSQPDRLDGQLIMSEWSRGRVASVAIGPDGRATTVDRLFAHLQIGAPIDADIAPDGALYFLDYGFGVAGRLLRIEHSAEGVLRPTVSISADATSGLQPFAPTLTATAKSTTRGDGVDHIEWDLGGDGTIDATGETYQPVLTTPGRYRVTAVAVSASGKRSLVSDIMLTSGNTPPTLTLGQDTLGPVTIGETINYKVRVEDAEDTGDLCATVVWRVRLGHDSHTHANAQQVGGCEFSSTIVLDDDHGPGSDLSWVVIASYMDGGLDGTGQDRLVATAESTTDYISPADIANRDIPDVIRRLLDVVATGTDVADFLRNLEWYLLAKNGLDGYVDIF